MAKVNMDVNLVWIKAYYILIEKRNWLGLFRFSTGRDFMNANFWYRYIISTGLYATNNIIN